MINQKLWGAGVLVSVVALACNSTGEDTGVGAGRFTTGWVCACPNGAASCPLRCPDSTSGTCQGSQPFCDIQIGDAGWVCACPNGQAECAITCPKGEGGRCASGALACGPADSGTALGEAGQCASGVPACGAADSGKACQTNADCPSGAQCGFPQSEGCAATGRCVPQGPQCRLASVFGCACDGTGVDTTNCVGGFPSGYLAKPLLHEGTCSDALVSDGGSLQWYFTCDYPACLVPNHGFVDADAGCPAAGSPCTQAGEGCGMRQPNCATLVCASENPVPPGAGSCPVSSRKYKDGIRYVDDAQLQTLHDQTLAIRLATYQYKPQVDNPAPTHLGFIIEDNPQTPAVDREHDRVDLYGYVSMVVAGMQVQEKEIARLRKDLDDTRRDLAVCTSTLPATTSAQRSAMPPGAAGATRGR